MPTSRAEVFDSISDADLDLEGAERFAYMERKIADANSRFAFMKNSTVQDYFDHRNWQQAERDRKWAMRPTPTLQQFWDAVYTYDPSAPLRNGGLIDLLLLERLDCVPLGKLNGVTKLSLKIDLCALNASCTEVLGIKLPPVHGIKAVSYCESHPSEVVPKLRVDTDIDKHVRRVKALGWVMEVTSSGHSLRTGHVLVIDMDDIANRQRHPWFLLAPEWLHEHEFDSDEGIIVRAEEFVEQGNFECEGILPGDSQRTTVARLRSRQAEMQNRPGPFLKYFGVDFEFELTRFGASGESNRHDPRYLRGTWLPIVMTLHWNQKTLDEICFNEDGQEYFRFHRPTGRYYIYVDPPSTDPYIEGPISLAWRIEHSEQTSQTPRGRLPLSYRHRTRPRSEWTKCEPRSVAAQ